MRAGLCEVKVCITDIMSSFMPYGNEPIRG